MAFLLSPGSLQARTVEGNRGIEVNESLGVQPSLGGNVEF